MSLSPGPVAVLGKRLGKRLGQRLWAAALGSPLAGPECASRVPTWPARAADGGHVGQVVRLYYNRARGPLPPTSKMQVRGPTAGLPPRHTATGLFCVGGARICLTCPARSMRLRLRLRLSLPLWRTAQGGLQQVGGDRAVRHGARQGLPGVHSSYCNCSKASWPAGASAWREDSTAPALPQRVMTPPPTARRASPTAESALRPARFTLRVPRCAMVRCDVVRCDGPPGGRQQRVVGAGPGAAARALPPGLRGHGRAVGRRGQQRMEGKGWRMAGRGSWKGFEDNNGWKVIVEGGRLS
jgi:hypothetical protein